MSRFFTLFVSAIRRPNYVWEPKEGAITMHIAENAVAFYADAKEALLPKDMPKVPDLPAGYSTVDYRTHHNLVLFELTSGTQLLAWIYKYGTWPEDTDLIDALMSYNPNKLSTAKEEIDIQ